MQATLPCSIHYLKANTLHSQTIHFYQPELVKSCNLVKIKISYPATLVPLAILASRPLNNTKSRSSSQMKFPLPAPVFSSHPEYRHKSEPNPASRQTYCGPSLLSYWGHRNPENPGITRRKNSK